MSVLGFVKVNWRSIENLVSFYCTFFVFPIMPFPGICTLELPTDRALPITRNRIASSLERSISVFLQNSSAKKVEIIRKDVMILKQNNHQCSQIKLGIDSKGAQ